MIVILSPGVGTGTCVAGKIETGHVQVGEGVLLLPANEIANIKGMCYLNITASDM